MDKPPVAHPDLLRFESWVRSATLQAYPWHELSLTVAAHAQWPGFFWALCTMHPNGFVRELAIDRMTHSMDAASAAPYLMVRTTDWVPQVREVAANALHVALDQIPADRLLDLLAIVPNLRRRARAPNAELWSAITERAVRSNTTEILGSCVRDGSPSVAGLIIETSLRVRPKDQDAVLDAAFASRNPSTRLFGARGVLALDTNDAREARIERMRRDRFMPIRRLALYEDQKGNLARAREQLLGFLMDRHPSIRNAARHYLSGIDSTFDPAQVYREVARTESGRRRAIAVAGLGEFGTPEDIPIIEPFVDGDRLTLAVFAVRAIGALGGEGRVAWATPLIADSRPRVAKEAARLLRKHLGSVDVEALRDIAADMTNPHARWLATTLLVRRHPFDAVADAILATTDPDDRVRDVGYWWLDRIYPAMARTEPTPEQVDRVRRAIERTGDSLSASSRAAIRSLIGF